MLDEASQRLADGHEVLTAATPKSIADVEAACGAAARADVPRAGARR